ncbi:MAG: hypothetical protein NVSMB45_18760 [Ginsengibacter sp.]
MFWTALCGCGHVWASVFLGLGGAALGWTMSKYKILENFRGGIAGWAMILFGIAYTLWGIRKYKKNMAHKHFELSDQGQLYVYEHRHGAIVTPGERHKVTPYVMFLIFVMGPCEPMIPLLYIPGVRNSISDLLILVFVYTACTLLIMFAMVFTGLYGFKLINTNKLEPFMPALSGFTILICGIGMTWLNW